ncbi:hypothetical protein [Shewanella sp. KCT]|uniref:hypothetical protein n=1 Tax=Shewanella sp. KCT TaxID=2569535 RepID=UPI00164234B3|nr:hypothetical protein [Shewanella sp. KCT]
MNDNKLNEGYRPEPIIGNGYKPTQPSGTGDSSNNGVPHTGYTPTNTGENPTNTPPGDD